ncbi:MAG TPA: iron ABC transporter permease [Intrasporangium sp.]|nr:iron ABC transporter permease [Intrasporangium sp.]
MSPTRMPAPQEATTAPVSSAYPGGASAGPGATPAATQPGAPQGAPHGRLTPTSLPLRLAALVVAAVCSLPVVVVVLKAFESGPGQAFDLVWRPRVSELLGNTVWLVVLTCTITAVLGVATAWLVERTTLPGAGFWRVALVAPLAVPAFVNSFAWASFLPALEGRTGAVLVTSLSYFPFVFLPVAAVLRSMDQGLEEAARSLGLGPWRAFLRVSLPQVRPALLGGVLLVGLHLLSEFGALAMLRYPTFTTAILDQFEVAFDNKSGSVLAVVLIMLALTLLTIELLVRGTRRHARVGTGTLRRPAPARLGRATPLALLGLGMLTALALGVPGWSIVRWLLKTGDSMEPISLLPTLWSTLRFALLAAAITTVAAFPVAWLLARSRTWFALGVERVTYVASSLPGVVVALALITLSIQYVRPLYQTTTLLVVAYVILFIPRVMVAIRAAIAQTPPELGEASRVLGSGPLATFLRVQLPLTLRGTLAGFALVFIAVSTELTATLLLAPTGTDTLATAFWSASGSLDYPGAAPYAAAMVLLSAPLTILLLRSGGADKSQRKNKDQPT